jgi:hypothetical protein
MRCDFFESIHPGDRKHPGFLVYFKFVAVGSLNFFTVREPDDEHGVPLESKGFASAVVFAERVTLDALKLCYAFLTGTRYAPWVHIRGPSGAKIP